MINVGDLRRAIVNGGDVSSFADVYCQALDGCPIPVVGQFDAALSLPDPAILLERTAVIFPAAAPANGSQPLEGEALAAALDVTMVSLPLYDKCPGEHLERIIGESRPDVIGLGCSPAELGAHIPYAFSMACAVGVPAQFEIIFGPSVEARFNGRFHPANAGTNTLLESWLRRIPLLPLSPPLGGQRSTASDDARYIASRIVDIARYSAVLGRKVRLLTIVDPVHREGLEQVTAAFRRGTGGDLYEPAEFDPECSQSFIVGQCLEAPDENCEESPGGTTGAQERFRAEFGRSVRALSTQLLSESEAVSLITQISGRTRQHRDIGRGASVRGSIAFDELLHGLSSLNGGLTRENVLKAAMIALPPRISVKQRSSTAALVSDIAKEVLYGIRFSPGDDTESQNSSERLSAGNIMTSTDEMKPGQRRQDMEGDGTGSFAVVPDVPGDAKTPGHNRELDLPRDARRDQYSAVKKAVMRLIGDLDNQLRDGKISPGEYERHRAGLMARLERATGAQLGMSDRELASTIIEMMDAQDGQWNSEVSLSRMRVYYHVKGTCEGRDVSPLKQDYHALKWLIDDLQQQQVLKATGDATEFTLTGFALDSLLRYLMDSATTRHSPPNSSAGGTDFTHFRTHEVRRYTPGDTFRDISVRHTLREIARKQKGLSDVTSADLRVFLKERRNPQVDVVFCIDISGSMGFRQKLVYARVAAAGLVEAAFRDGNRAGVVAFNDCGQTAVPLTGKDKDSLFNGIAGLTPRGNTNIGDGIKSARDLLLLAHNRNRKHIILISDGQASAVSAGAFARLSPAKGRDLTEDAALLETNRAAAAGVCVSVIYIAGTNETDDAFIKSLAKAGRGTVRRLSGLSDVMRMLGR